MLRTRAWAHGAGRSRHGRTPTGGRTRAPRHAERSPWQSTMPPRRRRRRTRASIPAARTLRIWASGDRTMTSVSAFRVDELGVRVFATEPELAAAAAAYAAAAILSALTQRPRASVMFASG